MLTSRQHRIGFTLLFALAGGLVLGGLVGTSVPLVAAGFFTSIVALAWGVIATSPARAAAEAPTPEAAEDAADSNDTMAFEIMDEESATVADAPLDEEDVDFTLVAPTPPTAVVAARPATSAAPPTAPVAAHAAPRERVLPWEHHFGAHSAHVTRPVSTASPGATLAVQRVGSVVTPDPAVAARPEWARQAPKEENRPRFSPLGSGVTRGVCGKCRTPLTLSNRRPIRATCPVCGNSRVLR